MKRILWLVLAVLGLATVASAQRFFPDGIALSNEYVRQQGLVDLAAWSGGSVTGETVRGLGVSLGQLSGVNPETGEAIADPGNLLPLAARSLSVAGTIIGDGSGLTNLNASGLSSGTVPAERLAGVYDITATNAQDAMKLNGEEAAYYRNANNLNAGTVADVLLSAGLQTLAGNDGGALTNLNADSLASGALPVERLSGTYDITATNAGNAARLGDVAATNYARTDVAETFETNVYFSGQVGIRTNQPSCALDVNGAINCLGVTIGGTPVSTSTDTYWSVSSGGGGKIQYGGGNVGVGAENPHASALLEVAATDRGMLIPRMTRDQRDAIGTPATGLLVYQTDNTPGFYFYDGAQWSSISAGAGAVTDVTASGPLASSGGTTPNLSIALADSTHTGALRGTDWVLFNARVPTNRTITTTAPLTGGGALSGNLTLALPAATTAVNGYLTSNDWTTFNAKVPTNRTITTTAPLTGGGALSGNLTLALPAATTAVNGYLTSNDWSTFNAKAPTNRAINTSTGLAGGGTLAADRTISLTGQALALHNLGVNGVMVRTGSGAVTGRSVAVSGNGIAVANGDGVSGNPTMSLSIGSGSTQVAAGNHTHSDYATPAGVIQAYGGASAPVGYLLCNGVAVSRATYASLFSAIGTNYGAGDGSTTFNVPNLQGKVPVGLSADAEFNVLGESGGAKTHTLASNEIPAHVHLVDPPITTTATNGSHTHSYNDRYRGTTISDDASDRNVASDALNDLARTTGSGGAHTHTLDIEAFNSGGSGGGAAHNNLQPYLVVNYIIKY